MQQKLYLHQFHKPLLRMDAGIFLYHPKILFYLINLGGIHKNHYHKIYYIILKQFFLFEVFQSFSF